MDDVMAVGSRLRQARLAAGLSQRRLAFPGCTPAYISRIEAGERIPSLQILRELGRRLGVTEDYLATGREAPAEEGALVEAEVALRLDQVELAERLYAEVLERATTDEERAAALAGLGQVAFRNGDPRRAIDFFSRALALDGVAGAETAARADTLGRAYAMVDELESAIAVFQRGLEEAERRDDLVETMRFAVLLSNALIDSGNFGLAEELLGRSLALAQNSRDPILRARLYWSQSRLHAERNDVQTAARYARRALEILQATEHTYYIARAHQLLAHIELDRRRPEEALALLQEGWPLLEESGNKFEQAQYRLEEARALAGLGRVEEAGALAMQVSGAISDVSPVDAGRSYSLLAETFEEIGDRARARELYELAAELCERSPNRYLVKIYGRLAALLEEEGRKDEALDVLKKAVQIQVRIGSSLHLPEE